MIDPLEQAAEMVERAAQDRAGLQRRLDEALMENHRLSRQLERTRERLNELDGLNADLEQRLELADERAERSELATRDHAARTA